MMQRKRESKRDSRKVSTSWASATTGAEGATAPSDMARGIEMERERVDGRI